MTLVEYANKYCKSMLNAETSKSIRELIAEKDDLPYDDIMPDSDGVMTKVVFVDSERTISIYDLISYSREDIVKMDDPALLAVFDNYMDAIDIEDVDLSNISQLIQKYKDTKAKEEADANGLLSADW